MTKKKIAQPKRTTKRTTAPKVSSTPAAENGSKAVEQIPAPPTYVLTKAQLGLIVGGNYEWYPHEKRPGDALRLACSALHQASNELGVLRLIAGNGEVDSNELDMTIYHLSGRLEMIAQIAMASEDEGGAL